MAVTLLLGCSLEVTVPDLGAFPDQVVAPETGADAADGPNSDALDQSTPDAWKPPYTIRLASGILSAACAKDEIIVGGGAFCPGSSIERSYIDPQTPNQWRSECVETEPKQETVAICVTNLAIELPQTKTFSSKDLVPCVGGDKPVGGGCWCGENGMTMAYPNPADDGWYCGCKDTSPATHLGMAYCIGPTLATSIGWEKVGIQNSDTAGCPSGKVLIGGGCRSMDTPQPLSRSIPDIISSTDFMCEVTTGKVEAFAICVYDPMVPP